MQSSDLKVDNLNVKKTAILNKLVAKSIRFNEINCVNATLDTLNSTNTTTAIGPIAFDINETLTFDEEIINLAQPIFDPTAYYVQDGNLVHIFTAISWSAPVPGDPETSGTFSFQAPVEPDSGVFQSEDQVSGSVFIPDFDYKVTVKAEEGTRNILFAIPGDSISDGLSHFWITYSLKRLPP